MVVHFFCLLKEVEENLVLVQEATAGEGLEKSRDWLRFYLNIKYLVNIEISDQDLCVKNSQVPDPIIHICHQKYVSFFVLLNNISSHVLTNYIHAFQMNFLKII